METVTLTIDGKQISVEKGKTVLQAAIEAGVQVPYYCYHPGIGIDGSCRVCLVKIEKMPKLQVSCSVTCTEGMVVHTQAPDVIEGRAGVFEFLLINHPLDCPVCDKGGECPLQDFSYSFGPDESRMEFPRRVFDGEGVKADVDFGPTLMLNRNRCIMCTRCIRFMREVDGDAQIGVVDRGYGSEISTFEEQGVHSLVSGNLMDVCPVGAITTRDYRFKTRPWDNPVAVDTICTYCEKGCNTTAWLKAKPEWAKGARLVRFTPRHNPDVNDYWMCDIGRFQYHWIESDERLTGPQTRRHGALSDVPWQDAITATTKALQEAKDSARFLVSAHASHEELYLVARLGQHLQGDAARDAIAVTWTSSVKPQPERTKFRVPTVDAPNVAGARAIGLTDAAPGAPAPDLSALRAAVAAGTVSTLYVIDPGPRGSMGDLSWIVDARRANTIKTLIVQGVLKSALTEAADIVLSGACFVEKDATYTNAQGRLQAASRAIPAPGNAMEDAQILLAVAIGTGAPLTDLQTPEDIRRDIASALPEEPGLAGIAEVAFAKPVAAEHWLQASNPSERWKWDFMFQDLPPVKFADTFERKSARDIIPLTKID